MSYDPNKPLNDDERKIIENDTQHIHNMKTNVLRRKRNIGAAMMFGWFGLALLAGSVDIKPLAFIFGALGLIELFQTNHTWKQLIELQEKTDE